MTLSNIEESSISEQISTENDDKLRWIDNAAKIISTVFHPVFVPTYFIVVLLVLGANITLVPWLAQLLLVSQVFISTCLVPVFILPVFKKRRIINSMEMNEKEERLFPILTMILSMLLCIIAFEYFLYKANLPKYMLYILDKYNSFLIGGLFSLSMAAFLNQYFKISLHMIAGGGWVAAVLYLHIQLMYRTDLIIWSFIITGITASARLWLYAHKPKEIYIGFGVGFATMLIYLMITKLV